MAVEAARRRAREEIGRRIRTVRRERDLTVEELAGRSGVAEFEIGFLENGRRSVRFETLLCLAEALGVPVTSLFERLPVPACAEADRRQQTGKPHAGDSAR